MIPIVPLIVSPLPFSPTSPIGLVAILATLFTGFALYQVLSSLWNCYLYYTSRTWHTAPGEIIEARVHAFSGRRYKAVITYRYIVGGRQHTANRLSFGYWGSYDRAAPAAIVARYAPGTAVPVLHDSRWPRLAVLERKINWLIVGLRLLVGGYFLRIGMGLLQPLLGFLLDGPPR